MAKPLNAAVRRAVSSVPSITASGSCVRASNNTYTAWTNGRFRCGLNSDSVTSLIPTPASPAAGIVSRVPAGVANVLRSGATSEGSSREKAASSASIAASIETEARSSSGPMNRI